MLLLPLLAISALLFLCFAVLLCFLLSTLRNRLSLSIVELLPPLWLSLLLL